MPSRSMTAVLSPGQLSGGMPGMPLNPPRRAVPIWNSGPAVELTELNRINVTVSVITPR